MWVIIPTIIIVGLVLTVWMLIDCITNEPAEGNDKIVWTILIILLQGGIGALLYYFVRRPQRIRQFGK
ncbi:hypothetical protein DB346_20345 [Verrucomicrobia bacterium LW23]|nr:hypothetical protein DB346_20345 [Verrucomicrobia bacterium LW23]